MSDLLRKPLGDTGRVHHITVEGAQGPLSAGWSYVGFDLYRLRPGEVAQDDTGDREVILVLVEGKADISGAGRDFGELGDRMDVFDRTPPHCVYLPNGTGWSARATTECALAVCSAPGHGGHDAQIIGPAGISLEERGKGGNTRYINNIAMEGRDVADSLLVTEVFTPAGNWSSYPPHRHDEDDYPNMTYLEETYYHRLNPAQGYGHQRVWTEDGSLDETMSVSNHDVVLVPRGHHPCGAPYGYDMYYLNVMAGPLRKWRFKNHPDHDWIYQRDMG
ncbi:5-deoxy-glucuronate isomerase [Aestuariicoccus sp. MJ-SS9]|uniref:5-deoxy-glucuronate isomerase n=1 Tax=Aestuariicoccus sp. MJ-SS9 TaxID=3079855 RepID=UPI00290E6737|nr:5-deoxy-glucuronate isomerase [Aestuariicoccus sp. MJ-SS9]MDU8910313.1 5-deoxy-glucuronate isomerase [Aestuariicoccus sp. MJ-SS9]